MEKMFYSCKRYSNPMNCDGYIKQKCRQCYSDDTIYASYCDECGNYIDDWDEKYEDYHNTETGKDICKNCREKGAISCQTNSLRSLKNFNSKHCRKKIRLKQK